ncbi:MAG: tetratricopeptide repeat protein [Ignavibacteriales bacterium]
MFGFGKKAEDWFESARRRSQKMLQDETRRIQADIERIRSGRGVNPSAEAEANAMRTQAYRAMIADLDRALGQKPDFAEAWFNKGNIHQIMGEREKALACYEKALQLAPAHPNSLFCVASIKRELGRLDEALGYYREAVRANPNDSDAWYEMAMVLRQSGNSESAKEAEERAQALQPNLKPRNGMVFYIARPRLFT